MKVFSQIGSGIPVGSTGPLTLRIEFEGPFLGDFIFDYTTIAGIDMTNAALSNVSPEISKTATTYKAKMASVSSPMVAIFINVKFADFAKDSSVKLDVYDTNSKIAHTSTPITISFVAATITVKTIVHTTPILGKNSDLVLSFTSKTAYPADSYFKL